MKKYWQKYLEVAQKYQFWNVFFMVWSALMMVNDYKHQDFKRACFQAFLFGCFSFVVLENPQKRYRTNKAFIERQLKFHEWVQTQLDKRDALIKEYEDFDKINHNQKNQRDL